MLSLTVDLVFTTRALEVACAAKRASQVCAGLNKQPEFLRIDISTQNLCATAFTHWAFEAMAKLVDLSNELLLIIVSYLATGDDVDSTALFNLCLTSRALLIVARPALYTCVRLAEPAPDPLKSLKVFLKTILAHPSLAKETQTLALINDRGIRYEWPALQKDPHFIDLSSSIGGHPSEIEPDLCYYPLAVEVLTRLPNLQHIRFTAEIESPHSLLERMHELQAQTSVFSKLKTFHLYVIPLTTYTEKPLKIPS
jgi:hypothetical protein